MRAATRGGVATVLSAVATVVAPEVADSALAALRDTPGGADAVLIGEVAHRG